MKLDGQIYIPLQRFPGPLISDMDEVLNLPEGKVHVVVEDFILVKHEKVDV